MVFDTKIAVVVREDLDMWQKLNVTAFLATGLAAEHPSMMGDPYRDAAGNEFCRLSGQPIIVLAASGDKLSTIHRRALDRGVKTAAYTLEMFATGFDEANRAVFAEYAPDTANIVGLALLAEKKIVDKITKGAKMHP